MNETLLATIGIASVVVYVIGSIPYYIDILRGRTRPERAAWWIWTLLGGIALAAQLASGAKWSALVTLIGTIDMLGIALFSLRYGYGSFGKRDTYSVIAAAVAVVLWALTDKPILALLLTISAELVGYTLILLKVWGAPRTETLIAWVASAIASTLGVLAAGHASFSVLLYPIYLTFAEWSVVLFILWRQKVTQQPIRAKTERPVFPR